MLTATFTYAHSVTYEKLARYNNPAGKYGYFEAFLNTQPSSIPLWNVFHEHVWFSFGNTTVEKWKLKWGDLWTYNYLRWGYDWYDKTCTYPPGLPPQCEWYWVGETIMQLTNQ